MAEAGGADGGIRGGYLVGCGRVVACFRRLRTGEWVGVLCRPVGSGMDVTALKAGIAHALRDCLQVDGVRVDRHKEQPVLLLERAHTPEACRPAKTPFCTQI